MSSRPQAPPIELAHVSLGYAGQPVLRDVNWTIRPGSMTALVGPNGGGKSTLLKALAGELKPIAGTISGGDPSSTGYLPQSFDFDRRFPIDVKHVVAMGLWRQLGPFGNLRKRDAGAIDSALERVGLPGFGDKAIGELSGGELQRVLFARLIVLDPAIILLDEPFAAMDRETVTDLTALIEGWHAEGRTIVAALHDLDHVRGAFPDAMRLAGGRAILGATEDILGIADLATVRSRGQPGAVA